MWDSGWRTWELESHMLALQLRMTRTVAGLAMMIVAVCRMLVGVSAAAEPSLEATQVAGVWSPNGPVGAITQLGPRVFIAGNFQWLAPTIGTFSGAGTSAG